MSQNTEWKYDSLGKRYRIDEAGSIEYAPVIQTTYGMVYMDELEEQNRRHAEAKQKQKEKMRQEQKPKVIKTCPFKAGGINSLCESSCSFYGETSCRLSMPDAVPHKDTEGKYCPIAIQCGKDCAMYSSGCTLIELIGAKAQKGKV